MPTPPEMLKPSVLSKMGFIFRGLPSHYSVGEKAKELHRRGVRFTARGEWKGLTCRTWHRIRARGELADEGVLCFSFCDSGIPP